MNASIVGIILSAIVLCTDATNYCSVSSCKGKTHIGCNNNGAFGSKCASNAKVVPITASLKTAILNKHNTLRNNIAKGGVSPFKPAARMATMQWDNELASLALLNAKQCVMEHDACRATDKFPLAGQNLASTGWSGTGTKDVLSIVNSHIQLWFNENRDATMSQINSYSSNGKKVGHFIQMVVEKATHIGCGIVRHTTGGNNFHFTACNYGFITIRNRPVYTTATKAGSKCKTGTNPSYKALCSTKEVYDVTKA